jgi:proteasome lid subunit RPN8/RPN11
VRVAPELYEDIVAHARAEAPNECCGIVASRDGTAVRVYRARNALPTPRYGYVIDPAELLRIYQEIERQGLEVGIIYHSHPRSEPYPSQADINLATWPDALYVIVGLAGGEPEVRAYTIRGGEVAEAELTVG